MHAAPRLRIAMLAPPWIPVPPSGYGGIETVVAVLTDTLVERGHDVTLFAAPGSSCAGRTHAVLDRAIPDEIGAARHEVDHVTTAFDVIEGDRRAFDVIHDHSGHVALAMADRVSLPLVHTEHGPFDASARAFYGRHGHRALIVGLTRSQIAEAPHGTRLFGAVANPLDPLQWHPGGPREDYALWLGRFAEVKGAHRAIRAAQLADVRLVLAGVVQPGQERYFDTQVAPHIDGDQVRFVGEVGGEHKRRLLARASALLMPIRWAEPFGMVMMEAMACGTPVIAFPEGAATELVEDGRSGMLVQDEHEMARALDRVAEIDPARCRARAIELCDPQGVARRYERAYASAIEARGVGRASQTARGRRASPVRPTA